MGHRRGASGLIGLWRRPSAMAGLWILPLRWTSARPLPRLTVDKWQRSRPPVGGHALCRTFAHRQTHLPTFAWISPERDIHRSHSPYGVFLSFFSERSPGPLGVKSGCGDFSGCPFDRRFFFCPSRTRPSAMAGMTARASVTRTVIFFCPRMVCCSKPSTWSRRGLMSASSSCLSLQPLKGRFFDALTTALEPRYVS